MSWSNKRLRQTIFGDLIAAYLEYLKKEKICQACRENSQSDQGKGSNNKLKDQQVSAYTLFSNIL